MQVNNELLKEIEVTDHLLLAIKLAGFGGKITAVPVTFPFYEWYKEWNESDRTNP
jgi:predicted PurR-regulated permease PerM